MKTIFTRPRFGLPLASSRLLEPLRSLAPRWLVEQPIAHRGLHDATRPENTLAAFEAAATAGYPIELDVHCSRDGVVVVFHDDTLDRLTARTGRLDQALWGELRTMAIGHSDQTIPSLDEVLDLVADRVPVVVEVKNGNRPGRLEHEVAQCLSRHRGRHTVQSFNPRTLVWFRRHAPRLPRGILATDFSAEPMPTHHKILLRHLALAPMVRPAYIGYDLRCLPYWAPTGLRKLGVPLLAWTIRNVEDLARARRLADNVIFESVRP